MGRHVLVAGLVVAALFLAGCTGPRSADASPASASPGPSGPATGPETGTPVFVARAELPSEAPRLPVALEAPQRWLKPFGLLEVASSVPDGSRAAWFVEHEEVEARATTVDGEVYVLKSTTPDHHMSDVKRGRADLLGIEPDGRARALRIDVAGRYTLAVGDARLVVNVWPDAPADASAQAILFDDGAGGVDPAPGEVDLPTGGRLLLWNQAGRVVDVREAGFAAHVPLPANGGRVTPIDEGLYRLVLVARDASGARGAASMPFLVDFERPAERLSVGPATGRFVVAETGGEGPVDPPYALAFGAQHPLRELVLRFNDSSPLPAPRSVEVTLLHENVPLASASTLTANELLFTDLPAGSYDVVVRPEHGAIVSFEVTVSGLYELPTPERLRVAMT